MLLADTNIVTQRSNRERTMRPGNLRDGILHDIESMWRGTETRQQQPLQKRKARLCGRRGIEPFPNFGGKMPPDSIERYNLIMHFSEGKL